MKAQEVKQIQDAAKNYFKGQYFDVDEAGCYKTPQLLPCFVPWKFKSKEK